MSLHAERIPLNGLADNPMKTIAGALAASLLLLTAAIPARAEEGGGRAAAVSLDPGGNRVSVPVASYRQLRLRSVVLQHHDFSCGSAALATLLTWHYGRPMGEEEVFEAMYRVGDQESIRRAGFSLLDMKSYLDSVGLPADGFKVGLDKLEELALPAVALIEVQGYRHFVVIRGIHEGRVLFADPARGLRAVPRQSFQAMWNGIVLLIRADIGTAQASFNPEGDWAALGRAPLAGARRLEDIGTLLLNLRPGR